MLQSNSKEIREAVINIYDMSKNIYKLCTEKLEDAQLYSKVSELYSERAIALSKLEAMKDNALNKQEINEFFKKYAKEIQKIVDLDGRIIEVLGKRKIEMAQELRKINSNMNVLIYK